MPKKTKKDHLNISDYSVNEIEHLIEDLQTHQIELELQNEELRQQELELTKIRLRYTDLYDFAPVGYLSISNKGLITESNLKATELLGEVKTTIINQPFSRYIPIGDQEEHYKCRKRLFESGVEQFCERRLIRKDLKEFDGHCKCVINKEVDGQVGDFRMILTDISDQTAAKKKIEEFTHNLEAMVSEKTLALERAQDQLITKGKLAAIGKLSGCVAHDIRNPLGVINNSIYFLSQVIPDIPTNKTVTKHLKIIEKEILRTNEIIDDLLDISKSTDAKPSSGNLNDFINLILKQSIIPKNIMVELNLHNNLPVMSFDHGQIQRIFLNLISNAIQAMVNGGTLTITTRPIDKSVEICFQDTGTGISQENVEKIFEPLYTSKTKGVGLGLTIAKTFVENHGGKIMIASELDKGTLFKVYLPITAIQTS